MFLAPGQGGQPDLSRRELASWPAGGGHVGACHSSPIPPVSLSTTDYDVHTTHRVRTRCGASDASVELASEIVALRLAKYHFLMAEEVDSRTERLEQHIVSLHDELGRRYDEIRTQERKQRAVVELARVQARLAEDDLRRRVIALEKSSLCDQERQQRVVVELVRIQAHVANDDLRRRVIELENLMDSFALERKASLCEAFKTFVFALLRVRH